MFDLVTGKAHHLPSHSTLPIVLSTTAQGAAAAVVLMMSAVFVAEQIPETRTVLAFVAPSPPPPAAPAPPAPAPRSAPAKAVTQAARVPPANEPVHSPNQFTEPVEIAHASETAPADPPVVDEGVPGGVEGSVPGGIVGGLVGGLPEPPPPPPPPPATREPIRIGGVMRPPALIRRVEPIYPPAAVAKRLQGVVILEALVDRDGFVADVKVLRSAGPVLDREALNAVRQWRYSPLVQDGRRERFILTVVLSFSVEDGL